MTSQYDREQWLTEQADFLLDDLLMPIVQTSQYTYDRPPFRISIGFANGRASRATAVCYRRHVSTDDTSEIYVSPTLDDSVEILAALTHELIHAIDDCASGHRGFFRHVALRAGLQPPMPHTTPSPELRQYLASYVDLLGPIPHARLDLTKRPKETTRGLKCYCVECGFTARVSRKWINITQDNQGKTTTLICPCCTRYGFAMGVTV